MTEGLTNSRGTPAARRRTLGPNLLLAAAASVFAFGLIEVGFRILDPFPFFAPWEVTRQTGLSHYDPELGWRGNPGARKEVVTRNGRALIQLNSQGLRDIEHKATPPFKDAVVFLGDSFTWGWEVESDAVFVNRLRPDLADYEVFNLAEVGYGTDQSLLAFRAWRYGGRLRLVILMFCENDLADNNANLRYDLGKPKFEIAGDELVLTNVPVPRVSRWDARPESPEPHPGEWLFAWLLHSHAIHDLWFRLNQARQPAPVLGRNNEPIQLTWRLLQALRDDVEQRGGALLVVAIPAKEQFMRGRSPVPYQRRIANNCAALGIAYFDLADAFTATHLRTYVRMGEHWNAHGHAVAAAALRDHLRTRTDLALR